MKKIYFQSMINVHIDVFIMIRKIFTLVLYAVNMETYRTFSNVLENFQKNRKNFGANLIYEIKKS